MASSKHSCGPCAYHKTNKDAYRWCIDCQEGYCRECEKMHRGSKMSRDHKLIEIEDYSKLSSIEVKRICEEHAKIFDSYCKRHQLTLCLSCVLSRHTSCKDDVIPLDDVAKNAKSSAELADLENTISVCLQNVQSIIDNTNVAYLDQQEKDLKEKIREIRAKINQRLDEMEKNLISKLELELSKYRLEHNGVLKHATELGETMKRLKEQTTEMKELATDVQMFLGIPKINREVHECFNLMSKYTLWNKYNVQLEIDAVLNSILTNKLSFGSLCFHKQKIQVPFSQPKIDQAQKQLHPSNKIVLECNVKITQALTIKRDSKNMWITGCTILPNGQLLIADVTGKKHLMQYNQNGTHVRDIPISNKPFDVTVIDSDRVAISYGDSRNIEIINIPRKTVEKRVDFKKSVWGLSYQGGKLYVVSQCGIDVVGLSGKILNTIGIDVSFVCYVTTSTDRIYFSESSAVTCCDMSGTQIWTFQDASLQSPFGLTVDNNQNVFVAGCDSQNVTLIASDGQISKTLLTQSDGLSSPQAIYFRKDTGDLLVCNSSDTKAFLCKITKLNP